MPYKLRLRRIKELMVYSFEKMACRDDRYARAELHEIATSLTIRGTFRFSRSASAAFLSPAPILRNARHDA